MSDLTRDVLALAAQYEPRRLLAAGEAAKRLLEYYQDDAVRIDHLDPATASPAADTQYDFALVAGYLEQVTPHQGAALLARLRDVQAQRFAVIVPEQRDTHWTPDTFIALGLSIHGHYREADPPLLLATYDIANYKRTPDWLSPKNWANPELWDKYRW